MNVKQITPGGGYTFLAVYMFYLTYGMDVPRRVPAVCTVICIEEIDSYKSFFEEMGYDNVEYHVVDGRMPCAIAVIRK